MVDHYQILGSLPGIGIFIAGFLILLSYGIYLGRDMYTLSKDEYQTVILSNTFEGEFNDLRIL